MAGKTPVRAIDVARTSGVSRATVSRAFTEGSSISEVKLRRVLEAADALGYRPNAIARTLTSRKSGIVGIVIADLVNPFYAKVLETTCQKLQERKLASLLLSGADAHNLDTLLPQLLSYQVDGVIVAAATLSSRLADRCAERGLPVVQLNRYSELDHVNVVCCDNIRGGRMVAEHLLGIGRQRMAFLAGIENTSSSRDREIGFRSGLAQVGLDLKARDVGNYVYRDALDATQRLLSRKPRLDALFCANDAMAIAAVDVARSLKIKVPEELAIVGFDNTPPASSQAYSLTSVDQNIDQMVDQAVAMIVAGSPPTGQRAQKIFLASRLEVRNSTSGGATKVVRG